MSRRSRETGNIVLTVTPSESDWTSQSVWQTPTPATGETKTSPRRSDPDNDRSEVTTHAICSRCRAHRARRGSCGRCRRSCWRVVRARRRTRNPKHFFWAPASRPRAPSTRLQNDIIYHGGNAGDGAIGVETKPAVYLVYWGTEWANGFTTPDDRRQALLEQDAPELRQLVHGQRRRQPVGRQFRRSTAATSPRARRAAPASRAPTTSRTRSTSSRACGPIRRRCRTTS